jgi:hypothetical protein
MDVSYNSDGGWERLVRERDQWGDPGIDGRIILRWVFYAFHPVVYNNIV